MRALLLLYYFPPSGGPGVQRGTGLARHLPAYGVEPIVVTVAPQTYAGPEEYAQDPSLEEDVPAGLRVVRSPGGERRTLRRLLGRARLLRWAAQVAPRAFFERQAGWYAPAVAATLAAIERERPDVLLTSSQPYVVHLVGREVRRRTGIPWVADFRDPWTLCWGRSWPSRGAFAWEDRREEEALADADAVVANTPGQRRELLERRPWLDTAKVACVPNGYEPADFATPAADRPPGELLVVPSGAFRARPPGAARRRRRGPADRASYQPMPVDLSSHAPTPLLEALAVLRRRDPGARVRVRLVGALDPRWLDQARAAGVSEAIEPLGYLPHRHATAQLLAADLLYLPTITRTDGEAVSNVPAKTYEYLGSGRPIAALAGPGDVRDLLQGRDRAVLLPPGDADALADVLAAAAAGAGPPAASVDPPDAHPWRRAEVARRMAELLRRAVG